MADFVVTSTADTPGDTSQGTGGRGTLRQAINYLKATGGGTISFDAALGSVLTFTSTAPLDLPTSSANNLPYRIAVEAGRIVTVGEGFSGYGALAKTGAGLLTFTGASSFGGSLTVSAGLFELGTGGALSSPIIVETGATLRGTGATASSVELRFNSVLAPGLVAGGGGAFTASELTNGGTIRVSLFDTADYTRLRLTNSAYFPQLTSIDLAVNVTAAMQIGTVYTILERAGTFADQQYFKNMPAGSTIAADGHSFRVSYTGGDGNDVTLTEVAPGSLKQNRDLNLDGKSDLVWRGTDGSVRLWDMNGAAIASDSGLRQMSSDWKVVGVGDVTSDARAEVILKSTDGTVRGWTVTQYISGGSLQTLVSDWNIAYNLPQQWELQRVADFNGDGKSDLLWRSSASGQLRLWQLESNNGSLQSNVPISSIPSLDWKVAGAGDFNGDGKSDLLWRNDNGANRIWFMNGSSITSDVSLGNGGASIPTNWKIEAVGDINGDGKSDIVWQSSAGEVRMWLMNGAVITSDIALAKIVGAWTVQDAADLNGDGYADVIWRETSGEVRLWTMNPAGIVSDQRVALIGSDWQIVNSLAG